MIVAFLINSGKINKILKILFNFLKYGLIFLTVNEEDKIIAILVGFILVKMSFVYIIIFQHFYKL